MSEAESFERIVASLHEAALDPARWSGASMLIDQALRAHGSSMVMGDGDSCVLRRRQGGAPERVAGAAAARVTVRV